MNRFPPSRRLPPDRSRSDHLAMMTQRGAARLPSLSQVPLRGGGADTFLDRSDHLSGGSHHRPSSRCGVGLETQPKFIQHDDVVDFVHHDSPCGPAVSVYPRGHSPTRRHQDFSAGPDHHLQQQQQRPHHAAAGGVARPALARRASYAERRRNEELWRAEEAKLAHFGVHHQHSRGPSVATVAGYNANLKPPPPRGGFEDGLMMRKPPPPNLIEISPGVQARLRGSAETRDYVRRDQLVPALCFACNQELFCIEDADFVICPHCRVVNPVEKTVSGGVGGVALGITVDMLYSLQKEIMAQERTFGNRF